MARRQRRPARSRIQYSHIPGQGPAGQTCRGCWHFVRQELGFGVCAEAARKVGLTPDQLHPIWDGTRACKDWRERV
jgi:hypothetical protein